jgi:hypothetical protein
MLKIHKHKFKHIFCIDVELSFEISVQEVFGPCNEEGTRGCVCDMWFLG